MQSAAATTRLSPRKYVYNIIIHYNVRTPQRPPLSTDYDGAKETKTKEKNHTIRRCTRIMIICNTYNNTFIIRKMPGYDKNNIIYYNEWCTDMQYYLSVEREIVHET
jgi:hypothetical protein